MNPFFKVAKTANLVKRRVARRSRAILAAAAAATTASVSRHSILARKGCTVRVLHLQL